MNNIIDRFSNKTTLFALSGIIFISSLVVLSLFQSAESSISQQQKAAILTHEMMKSSDNLTNYARYYVATKREDWKNEFDKVLDVRNGVLAGADGVKKSFKDKLKESGIFLKEETDILLKAEELSNNLAKIENEAFKFIGLWKKEETYSEYQLGLEMKAQTLVFGEDYVRHKKEIDNTSLSFYNAVVNRLKADYERTMFLAWTLITAINVALLMLVLGIMNFKPAENPVAAKKSAPAKKVTIRKPAIKR
jgi:hypothetical protein